MVDPAAMKLSDLALDGQGVLDSDLDGLADALETFVYGSDQGLWNSSGTNLPDGWLANHGYDPRDPGAASRAAAMPPATDLPTAYGNRWPDAFRPTLAEVYAWDRPATWDEATQGPYDNGLDPRTWDSNEDGLPDGWLMHYGLDPLAEGLPGRQLAGAGGLTVLEAFRHNTDPTAIDSDGDGLADRSEIDGVPNPVPGAAPSRFPPTDPARFDTAGTGVCDGYLVANGLDPNGPQSSYGDLDLDGASTREEYLWSQARFSAAACAGQGLDPRKQSTSGSGLPDGWLIRYGLDALDAGIAPRITQSSAMDPQPSGTASASVLELTVGDEYSANRPPRWSETGDGPWWGGTDPSSNDTDGDGLGDAWELAGYRITVATEPGAGFGQPYTTTLDPTQADSDGDGLSDFEEAQGRTDGRRQDTDFDGLSDLDERRIHPGLDPRWADSINDTLRDGERYAMLLRRSAAYASDLSYEYPGQPNTLRNVEDWICLPTGLAGAQADACKSSSPSGEVVAALLGPRGDADGNGIANIIDKDIDGDGLRNGLEIDSRLYEDSDWGVGDLGARHATDPLNPDTDGDLLTDRWEVEHGRAISPRIGAPYYDLDPSLWNSDGVGPNDGAEDFDKDGLNVHFFIGTGHTVLPKPFTNLREYQFGTDPHKDDSEGDGLKDGWEAYWSTEYAGPRDHAADINVKAPQGVAEVTSLLYERTYARVTEGPLLSSGEVALIDVTEKPQGQLGAVTQVAGVARFRLQDAQALETNPYLVDTDGDGTEDWWEALHDEPLPGSPSKPGSLCKSSGGPSPLAVDGDADPDQDGLSNLGEFRSGLGDLYGGSPLCPDTDGGGIPDGDEVGRGKDPGDPLDDALDGSTLDTDMDGVRDVDELRGVFYPGLGTVRTQVDRPDTDGDGLLDGPDVPPSAVCWTRANATAQFFLDLGIAWRKNGAGCYTFFGERPASGVRDGDPLETFDHGSGIPAGWLEMHHQAIDASSRGLLEHYRLGRPSWWEEPVHGPWWGGIDPNDPLPGLTQRDLDGDLLDDFDEARGAFEDLFPAANPSNSLRSVAGLTGDPDPRGASVDPQQRRLAAQAYINPAPYTYANNQVEHPKSVADGRSAPCLLLDTPPSSLGLPTLRKGEPFHVAGRLRTSCAGGVGLAGIAVEARAGSPSNLFGIGVTDGTGGFSFDATIVGGDRGFAIQDSHGLQSALLGVTEGSPEWRPDPSTVAPGDDGLLTVRSYGTAAQHRAEKAIRVLVTSEARLTLDVPEESRAGQPIPVRLTLQDSGGSPLDHPVEITWDVHQPFDVVPSQGLAEFSLPPPTGAGTILLHARSRPPTSDVTRAEATDTVRVLLTGILDITRPETADAGRDLGVQGSFRSAEGRDGIAGAAIHISVERSGVVHATVLTVTSSTGHYQGVLRLPATLSSGEYSVVVSTPGTEIAAPAQGEETLTLRSLPAFRDVLVGNLTAGGSHPVAGTLREPDGQPLANAVVSIRLGAATSTVRTLDDGKFQALLDATLPPGLAVQEVSFAGDARHGAAHHRAERTVLSKTLLSMKGETVARGGDALILARLTDNNSAPVRGAAVTVTWGPEPARTAITNSTGWAALTREGSPSDALGPVTVRARYGGSPGAGLASSETAGSWLVQALAAIVLPDQHVEAGGVVPSGRLADAGTGQPLAGRAVTVRLDNRTAMVSTTDALGRFPLMPPVPETADPHAVRVETAFDGDDTYPAAHAATTLLVRSPARLHILLPPLIVSDQPAFVPVDLTDARGQDVAGGVLEARLGGRSVGAALVRGEPLRLNLTLPLDAPPGPTQLEFRYSGSDSHGSATAFGSTRVLAKAVLLTHAAAVPAGEVAVIDVQLLAGGIPQPGQPVTIQMEGVPVGVVATTDADGVARFQVPQTADGLRFMARYAGDELASPAAVAGVLTPLEPPTLLGHALTLLPWVAAVAALALGGVALYLRLALRHPLGPAFAQARRALSSAGGPVARIMLAYRALEDAAIASAVLSRPATTPRVLEAALAPHVPGTAQADLRRLISLFEEARYSRNELTDSHCDQAVDALRRLQRALGRAPRPAAAATGAPW